MTNEHRLTVLKSLLNVSNKILGSFISKNKFESEEKVLYTYIKENKEPVDKGLFLIPTHSINELKRESAFDESETESYLRQIEMINLAIFAYNVYKGEEYETCINNFFTSIMNKDEPTAAEIEFYVKLRHIAFAAYCKENKTTDISKVIKLFFPQEPEKFYFSSETNYDVIVSLNDYCKNLLTQSTEEIINIPTLFNDSVSPLRDFVGNRYQKLEPKLHDILKRKNEEESSPKKKAKTSSTYIAIPEVGESGKAKAARLFDRGLKGRRLTEQETFSENNLSDIMDPEDEIPYEPSDSDSLEEVVEEEEEEQQKDGDDDKEEQQKDDDDEGEEEQQKNDDEEEGKEEISTPSSEREVDENEEDGTGPFVHSPESSRSSPETAELFSPPPDRPIIIKRKVRKPSKPWTKEEVQALENGLRKFRRPYWAFILDYAKPVLDDRTGINLKDKARTMIRELERRGCTEPDQFGPYKFVKNPDRDPKYNIIRK